MRPVGANAPCTGYRSQFKVLEDLQVDFTQTAPEDKGTNFPHVIAGFCTTDCLLVERSGFLILPVNNGQVITQIVVPQWRRGE